MLKISIATSFAMLLSFSIPAAAEFHKEILDAHNQCRLRHHAANVVLDNSLAKAAQSYAEELARTNVLVHSDRSTRSNIGENLYSWSISTSRQSTSKKPSLAEHGVMGVSAWCEESAKYDFSRPGYVTGTGHFTQVVWKSTQKIGCGAAESKVSLTEKGQVKTTRYVVCRYSPTGNLNTPAAFRENVRP